jgi:hypothetical protein
MHDVRTLGASRLQRPELKHYLLAGVDTEHRRTEAIAQRPLRILLTLFAHVSGWPKLLPVIIVGLVQVTLASAVVRGVDSLSTAVASIRSAPMCQVRAKNEKLSYFYLRQSLD